MSFTVNPFTGLLDDTGSGSSSAPANAEYVVISTDATLTNERVLTGTSNQITITDNGAGSTVVLSLPEDVTLSGSSPSLTLSDTTASAKSLVIAVDANVADLRESAGASGSLLALDLANNFIGVGGASPASKVHIFDTANTSARGLVVDQYSTDTVAPAAIWRKARGTVASPTQVLSGDSLGFFGFRGRHSGGAFHTASTVYMQAFATENFTSSTAGGYIVFGTTPTGSSTNAIRLIIGNAGLVTVGATEGTAQFNVISGGSSTIGQIIRGASSQSASLQEWHNSSSTVLASLTPAGILKLTGTLRVGSLVESDRYTELSATSLLFALGAADDYTGPYTIGPTAMTGSSASGGAFWIAGQTGNGGTGGSVIIASGSSTDVASTAPMGAITFQTGAYLSYSGGSPTAGTERMKIAGDGTIVINETGADADVRIEGDTNANLFFVDASTDRVGIGTNSPSNTFHVKGANNTAAALRVENNGASTSTAGGGWQLVHDDGAAMASGDRLGFFVFGGAEDASNTFHFGGSISGRTTQAWTASANGTALDFEVTANSTTARFTALRIDQNGALSHTPIAGATSVFNEDGVDSDLRIESDNKSHMLFVDAGFDSVLINGSTDLSSTFGVTTTAAADKGIVIIGSASQSANLLEAQTSASAVIFSVGPTGRTVVAGDELQLTAAGTPVINFTAATTGLIASAGNFIMQANSVNILTLNSSQFRINGQDYSATLNVPTMSDSQKGVVVRANSGTQSADLMEFQSSAGGDLLSITTAGYISGTSEIIFDIGGNALTGINSTGFLQGSGRHLQWASSAGASSATADTFIGREGAANIRLGVTVANPPIAQTLSVQNASGTDIAGANFSISGSAATGNAVGGSILFKTSDAGGSGTTLQTLTTKLTVAATSITASVDISVPDEAYGSGWNASTEVPTKNAVYDKIQSIIVPRVSSETSSATPTINTDNVDAHSITALATDVTSMTTNLSGTPSNFQQLTIRFKDDGTARAITWGASFEAKGVALPTTTVISKVLTVGFIYDTVTSKWGCVASAQEA